MDKNNKTLGIIPARLQSSRFPEKVLVMINGKTMIQRVYEQAMKTSILDKVIVATDHEKILQTVQSFGGHAIMTNKNHQTGTDRCGEIIKKTGFEDFQTIVNIQGDEPFIEPQQIEEAVFFLQQYPQFSIATLAKKIKDEAVLWDPNTVKVVFGNTNNALYFSRHPIPFQRDVPRGHWLENGQFYQHIGLYVFQRAALLKLLNFPKGILETAESLEQLRWLENGLRIGVGETRFTSIGIDTPEDLQKALSNH